MTTRHSPAQTRALRDVEKARQQRMAAARQYRDVLVEAHDMGITLTALGQAAGTSCEAVRLVIKRNAFTRDEHHTQP